MAYEVLVKEVKPLRFAGVRAKTTLNKVTEKVTQLLNETADYLEAQGIEPTGPGFGIYYEVGTIVVDLEVGYPVDVEIEGNERVHRGELPAVNAATTIYEGPHNNMPDAHRAVQKWMHESEVSASEHPVREIYLTDLRQLADGQDCTAESVWPIIVPPSRAERHRDARTKS